ncbi:insulin-like growth factor-binding protein complex acid labile subunit [Pollicipes pollicipes]|uniref:insulin-like growth factor-binding protein complex acid labile subunit n=1 Tax=Pollicipes pollicipes TaxID=41117 RepID=UPI001884D802|nr:insulin-like growth factor-binding protein complex acid labile subunit [Pollicipes pollicipes]
MSTRRPAACTPMTWRRCWHAPTVTTVCWKPGAAPRSLITLSDSALRGLTRLEYLHLEHVLLSPDPAGPSVAEYRVEELDGASAPHSLLVEEQPRIVPYEEFRQRQAPRYSNFANLTALRFLRLAHAGLEEISWELFEGLDALRQLSVEHQLLRTVPDFAFYGCPNLRRLSLADNLLTINMKSFAGLLDLEELDLSNNLISELSYISLAPFPRLRELSLLGNPTQLVYSGALDMMNRTEVLRLGGADVPLELMPHALDHLAELRELTVANVTLPALTGVEFAALPRLVELELHGSVPRLEFDALRSNGALERLDLSRCHLEEVSQDAFLGLARLTVLDLSHNLLEDLPSEVFSPLVALREVYLHHNLLSWLSPAVLGPVRPKLLQIHHNPWECSCQLSFLSAAMTNKVRSSRATICRWDSSAPSGRVCKHEEREHLTYDVRVEPRCHQPEQYRHWGLYEVLRRELRCKRAPPPPTAARGGKYLTLGEADDADYQLIAADDVVLLDDPTEYEDYGEADAGYADEELAMAEYAADDYGRRRRRTGAAMSAEQRVFLVDGQAVYLEGGGDITEVQDEEGEPDETGQQQTVRLTPSQAAALGIDYDELLAAPAADEADDSQKVDIADDPALGLTDTPTEAGDGSKGDSWLSPVTLAVGSQLAITDGLPQVTYTFEVVDDAGHVAGHAALLR